MNRAWGAAGTELAIIGSTDGYGWDQRDIVCFMGCNCLPGTFSVHITLEFCNFWVDDDLPRSGPSWAVGWMRSISLCLWPVWWPCSPSSLSPGSWTDELTLGLSSSHIPLKERMNLVLERLRRSWSFLEEGIHIPVIPSKGSPVLVWTSYMTREFWGKGKEPLHSYSVLSCLDPELPISWSCPN